jgi:hypothetical protein
MGRTQTRRSGARGRCVGTFTRIGRCEEGRQCGLGGPCERASGKLVPKAMECDSSGKKSALHFGSNRDDLGRIIDPTQGSETGFPACQRGFCLAYVVRRRFKRPLLYRLSYTLDTFIPFAHLS